MSEVTFDTSELTPKHRFEAACAHFDGLCDLRPIGKSARPYQVRNTSWRIGDFVANRASHGPTSITMCNDEISRGYCAIRYFSQGTYQTVSDKSTRRLGPGFLSSGAELDGFTTTGFDFYSLEAPFQTIDPGLLVDGAFRAVSVDSPDGRILFQMKKRIFEGLGGGDMAEPLVEQVRALFETLSHGLSAAEEAARPAFLNARISAMHQFIDKHLDDPKLGPAQLSAAFRLSRAGVFRVFEPCGGVANAIARRRMVRAYRMLATAPPRRGLVRLVAEECGYPDSAHFCRVFRRHMHVSPGEIAGLQQPVAVGDGVEVLRNLAKIPRLLEAYR